MEVNHIRASQSTSKTAPVRNQKYCALTAALGKISRCHETVSHRSVVEGTLTHFLTRRLTRL